MRSLVANTKLHMSLLVYSLATIIALLQALRSGWGPPLELALTLSNANYWVVFVDVFADLLAFVWSNPDTQYTLLWIAFTISVLLNSVFICTHLYGDVAMQGCPSYEQCQPSNVSQDVCTAINSRRDLHQALADVGDWYGLCLNFEVSEAVSQTLKHSSKDVRDKKRDCLDAFFDLGEGEACWEKVVRVVAEYPIENKRLAKEIAKQYGIDFETTVRKYIYDREL